jgi:hypothetical protein
MWALTAHEFDLSVTRAYKHIAIMSGAPVISAELGRKLALQHGCEIVLEYDDETRATVSARRPNSKWSQTTYTALEAKRAGYFDVSFRKLVPGRRGHKAPR